MQGHQNIKNVGKDLKGGGSFTKDILFPELLEGTEELHIPGVGTETRTVYLPNTSVERYLCSTLLVCP